jgi:hypothetical protein
LDLSGHLPLPAHHHHQDLTPHITSAPNLRNTKRNYFNSNHNSTTSSNNISSRSIITNDRNNNSNNNNSNNNNSNNNNSSGKRNSVNAQSNIRTEEISTVIAKFDEKSGTIEDGQSKRSRAVTKAISNTNSNNNNSSSFWKDLSCFICPLTNNIMNTPIVASDGYSYDKDAFLRWIKYRTTSPVLGTPLSSLSYYHNLNLQRQLWIRHINMNVHFFDTIPYEVLFMIFSNLDAASLEACSQVCSYFRIVASDHVLWKRLLLKDFGIQLDVDMRIISQHRFKPIPDVLENDVIVCDLRVFYGTLKIKSKFRNSSLSMTHNLVLASPLKSLR